MRRDRTRTFVGMGAAIGLALLVVAPSLPVRDLWSAGEARAFLLVRDSCREGHYIVPHVNDAAQSGMSPLFFWLSAAAWQAGAGAAAGRIVTGLAAACMLAAVYLFARRYLPRAASLMAAVATAGCVGFLAYGRAGIPALLLALCQAGVLMLGYAAFHARRKRATMCWAAAYGLTGVAVVAGGCVALIVPVLVLVGYGVLRRRHVRAGGKAHLFGLLLLAVIVYAWVVPAMATGGADYVRAALLDVGAGAAASWPFHYRLVFVPLALFPWVFLLPMSAAAAVRRRRDVSDVHFFALLWLAVGVGLFLALPGRHPALLLCAVPAVGLLTSWYVSVGLPHTVAWRRVHGALSGACLGIIGLCVMALLGALAAMGEILRHAPAYAAVLDEFAGGFSPLWTFSAFILLALLLAIVLTALALLRSNPRLSAALLAFGMVALAAAVDLTIIPLADRVASPRHFSRCMAPYLDEAEGLYIYVDGGLVRYCVYSDADKPVRLIADTADAGAAERLQVVLSVEGGLVLGRDEHFLGAAGSQAPTPALTPAELARLTLVKNTDCTGNIRLIGRSTVPPADRYLE